MRAGGYEPFEPGPFAAEVRALEARDAVRQRLFPCEIWHPVPHARSEPHALVLYSHPSGGNRRSATYLCSHLASHGYAVAAMDHSERVAPELARRPDETSAQTAARWQGLIESRVPDVRFLLEHVLVSAPALGIPLDPERIGIVGHSLGGWTALAAAGAEPRIRAVAALAPAGASVRKPGILPVTLSFDWGRDVPALYLVAENDTSLPLAGMHELFQRTPGTKRMWILRRADHAHFMDDTEALHEAFRTLPLSGDLAAIQKEMRPAAELCPGALAHRFARGLVLCHLDAALRGNAAAQRLLRSGLEARLAGQGIAAAEACA